MYQKVAINSNDGTGKTYLCQFRTQSQLDKFINKFQDYPGFCIFTVDHWDERKTTFHLPVVSATTDGFLKVVSNWKKER